MNDPLEQFRKRPLVRAQAPAAPTGREEYTAFDSKDRVTRLEIRSVKHPARAPGYDLLMDIIYDDSHWTHFILVYYFVHVLVRGKNLRSVVAALRLGTAEFIQEFDPTKWERPKDANTPVIESVEFQPQDGDRSGANHETPGMKMH